MTVLSSTPFTHCMFHSAPHKESDQNQHLLNDKRKVSPNKGMTTEAISLPKGVGQLPTWWLEEVPHDTRDDVLRSQRRVYRQSIGLPVESHEDETRAIEMQKQRLDSMSVISSRSLGLDDMEAHGESTSATNAAQQGAPQTVETDGNDSGNNSTGKPFKLNITMTSDEEGAAVEARRQKALQSEDYGQQKLRARPGNVKTVDSVRLNQDQYGNTNDPMEREVENKVGYSIADPSSVGEESARRSSTSSASPTKRLVPPNPKKFDTAFTGVSPFDFAMQQRAREKERRETERLSRESLVQHHGGVLLADKAAEHKAKEDEERRKKKEAEDLLKMFKAADLDKHYEVAAELKKLQIEDKLKKKEAEEHLKGYRER